MTISPFDTPGPSFEFTEEWQPYTSRQDCPGCSTREAKILFGVNGSNQDAVRCARCGRKLYNAPKAETGRAVRARRPSKWTVDPSQAARVRIRDRSACTMCRTTEGPLEIGHLISVAEAQRLSPSLETALRSDANLALMCGTCNADLGARPVSLLWMAALHMEQERRRNDDL